MITEAEAKTKWCPMARLSEMGGTQNRAGPEASFYCIGSHCMAWRHNPNDSPKISLMKSAEIELEKDNFFLWERRPDGTSEWLKKSECRTGYCGAFGKPEAA